MKLTFFSNYLNHHQLPLAQSLYNRLGGDYRFVCTTPIPTKRLLFGYDDLNKKFPFTLTVYDSEENLREACLLADESDIVILGSASDAFILNRLRAGKLTFKYCERLFKHKTSGIKDIIKDYLRVKKHFRGFHKYPLYCLGASAYVCGDINAFLKHKNKVYKWGYFTEFKKYDDVDSLVKAKEKNSILWVGRFLELKHPEMAVEVARRLKEDGFKFKLSFIGSGVLEDSLKERVHELGMEEEIEFLGSMPAEQVRKHMEMAEIFLFTSDFHEGWGAVMNEAMNSACACVASHACGSVPFLVKHQENGLIFESENIEEMYGQVKLLLEQTDLRIKMSKAAYSTIAEEWNPEIAAERLLALCEDLTGKKTANLFSEGPCSMALPIRNDWIRSRAQ